MVGLTGGLLHHPGDWKILSHLHTFLQCWLYRQLDSTLRACLEWATRPWEERGHLSRSFCLLAGCLSYSGLNIEPSDKELEKWTHTYGTPYFKNMGKQWYSPAASCIYGDIARWQGCWSDWFRLIIAINTGDQHLPPGYITIYATCRRAIS